MLLSSTAACPYWHRLVSIFQYTPLDPDAHTWLAELLRVTVAGVVSVCDARNTDGEHLRSRDHKMCGLSGGVQLCHKCASHTPRAQRGEAGNRTWNSGGPGRI